MTVVAIREYDCIVFLHKDDISPSVELGCHVRSDHDLSMIRNLMCSDEAKHGASSSSAASSSSTEILTQCTVSTQKYGNSMAVYEWEENRTPPQPSGGVKRMSGRHCNRECVGKRGRVGVNLWEAFQYNSQSVFSLYSSQLNHFNSCEELFILLPLPSSRITGKYVRKSYSQQTVSLAGNRDERLAWLCP